MNVFDRELDKKIESLEKQVEELKQQRESMQKKFEAFNKYEHFIEQLVEEHKIKESELFALRSQNIESWIISMSSTKNPSSIYNNLLSHFEKVLKKAGVKKNSASNNKNKNTKKIPVGVYKNPITGETVSKKRRSPFLLENWIAEYGFGVVKSWLVKPTELKKERDFKERFNQESSAIAAAN